MRPTRLRISLSQSWVVRVLPTLSRFVAFATRAGSWALLLLIFSASAARAQNITAGGIISTAAGSGGAGSAGSGGLATATPVGGPDGVALDRAGNIYLLDRTNDQVDVVNTQAAAITVTGVTIQPGNVAVIVGSTGSCGTAGAIGDGGPAIDGLLCGPLGLALDASGNIYIADNQDLRIRIVNTQATAITVAGVTIPPNDIATVVGTGVSGSAGDGGAATSATLTNPSGVALDAAGNIYIADEGADVVRVVNTQAGSITIAGVTIAPNDIKTIAGTADSPAYTGDGGAATSAKLSSPYAVALDAAGNIYIDDDGNEVVRVVNPQASASVTVAGVSIAAGDIKTIAGNGTSGYMGNGGAATSAELNNPLGVFVEANGNILIADANNSVIRLVTTTGTISTFAGDNTFGFTGDGGFATSAELSGADATVSDAAGDVYIADFNDHRIREVVSGTAKFGSVAVGQSVTLPIGLNFTAGETLATISASGDNTVSSVGTCTLGVAFVSGNSCILSVKFTPTAPGPRWFPVTVTDSSGNIYSFALQGTGVAPATAFTPGIIATIVGTGTAGFTGDGGPATAAEIGKLWEATVDSAGNLYLVDHDNQRIRVVNRQSSAITVFGVTIPAGDIQTVAGNGTAGALGDGGAATSAEFYYPEGVVLDGAGNLYIADSINNKIRKVTAAGIISTVAGGGSACGAATDGLGDGCPATQATINSPNGVGFDASGNLYIVDTFNNRIRKVSPAGIITTVAGGGSVCGGATDSVGDGCAATSATLDLPGSALVDAAGNLYIADTSNNRVRKVNTNGVITTVAGTGTAGFSGDGGLATSAELDVPFRISIDAAGDLYVDDQTNERIRMVATNGDISTVAGDGIAGFMGDSGSATASELSSPDSAAVDGAGNLYIADGANSRIRKVSVTLAPTEAFGTLEVGQTSGAMGVGLSDVGNAALSISSLTWPTGFAMATVGDDCAVATPVTLGGKCDLGTVFSPSTAGAFSASLGVASNAFDAPSTIALTGTANLPVTALPATLTFSNQPVAQLSATQAVTLTNPTGAAITGIAITFSGTNGTEFTETDNCTATLAANSSCTINVGFTPTAVGSGSHTGEMSIADSDPSTPQVVMLTGTAVKGTPVITWATPAAITYGTALSSTQLDASASVSGVFAYTPASGSTPAAGSDTLSVVFTPTDTTDYAATTATVNLTVNQAIPTVTWTTPAAITYGTALSATQLDATASTAGTFVYAPASGTVLTAGFQTLHVTFTPTDAVDYTTATGTTTLTVDAAAPVITWATPAAITYGTALSGAQLDATASVPGTFVYTPAAGIVLGAGSKVLDVTFSPTDAVDYTSASAGVFLTVNKATPVITWATPAAITYGTALSVTQLDATASTAGTFVYSPASGTVLTGGAQTLNVTFTPTDGTDYTTATGSTILTVNKAAPVITWAGPAAITYGTALSGTQLDATASVGGTFVYTPAAGAVLTAGAQVLDVTFSPTDTVDYTSASAGVPLTVNKAVPVVTWATPAAITYGTALSATQLDATASVPGTFVYAPAAGAVPLAGSDTLGVTFTPTDSVDYTTVTANVTLVVHQATPVITWATPAAITYGTALSATQLDATTTVAGTFAYSPAAATVPGAGSQTLHVTFTPTDAVDYTTATATTTLTVNQATPVITWATPAAITYLTALSGTQLDATTTTAGTFVYTPASGTVLTAGAQTLHVTFTPTDTTDFTTAAGTTTLTVNQATPVITWTTPAAITYPTALSGTQLDATASVGGTFVYSPVSGSTPTAGNDFLTVTFTPTDAVDYTTATANVTLVVHQATPVITWGTPAAITYPTPLSATQLDATASVPGTFVYAPAAASVPLAGSDTLNVAFTPTDAVDYTTATANVTLTVNKGTPVITWATPAAITYGTALSATQLDATTTVPGTFAYTPAAATVLAAGSQTLHVTFTPTDAVDYNTASGTTTLVVNQATPVITWAAPAAIAYGTALSATQLDATTTTAGSFAYTPASGTVLTAGAQTLHVTFTPTDTTDFTTATATTTLTVNQAAPVITWATPAAITYPTPLSGTQLDATASVGGTFVYSPLSGTVPTAGNDFLSVTFTPTDAVDYSTATANVTLVVHQATSVITWGTPAAITYGTALSGTQLDATASVAGTFVYSPLAGSVPAAGSDTLSVTFTPTDAVDNTTATATVTLVVNKAAPVITWATPAAITYGTALSVTQLDATANVPGTFVYTPAAGSVPAAGTQVLDVTFSPTDAVDYTSASAGVNLTVNKATPVITWATPAAIAYLTPLSATQLDATASTAGTFVYAPASGTVLTAGAQTLDVTFTPTDGADYTTATANVTLTVNQATPVITWATPAAITYPTALSGTQLDATASVAGTFVYSPLSGTVPTAGNDFLSVTFTPTDAVDYATATANVTLVVHQELPVVTWATPAAITYLTPLSATQLDATASTAGTFAYTPSAGTVLGVGSQTLNVTFTPTDAVDFSTATGTTTLTVNKATPTITWATPAAISYNTALSATQLDATASTAGTFVYAPPLGTVLGVGSQTLNVTFTPTDAVDFTTATGSTTLTVNKATPVITWATPAAITYNTALSATQLDATANTAGTFVYAPLAGVVLGAGSQTLSVTFTPTDATDFATATGTTTLLVNKATPVITWAAPAAIAYGTALSATQLDATASVAGTFVYAPLAGVTLGGGAQVLATTFTPTDAVDYTTATATVTLTVNPAVTTTTLVSSTNPSNANANVTFMATVTYAAGSPTGSVTFSSGATLLATVTLSSGSATLITAALPLGADNITATFIAGTNFATSTSPILVQTVIAPNFTIAPASVAPLPPVAAGQAIIIPITLGPATVAGGTVLFSATGLPPNSSIVFAPPSLSVSTVAQNTVITLQTTPQFPYTSRHPGPFGGWPSPRQLEFAAIGLLLAAFGLFWATTRKRRGWVLAFGGLALAAILGGCATTGSSGSGTGNFSSFGTTPGTYPVVVTGSDGSYQHSTTVNVVVN